MAGIPKACNVLQQRPRVPCTESQCTVVAHPDRCDSGAENGVAIAGTAPGNEEHPDHPGGTCRELPSDDDTNGGSLLPDPEYS